MFIHVWRKQCGNQYLIFLICVQTYSQLSKGSKHEVLCLFNIINQINYWHDLKLCISPAQRQYGVNACSTIFRWEPEGRFRHRLYTAVAPFRFSTVLSDAALLRDNVLLALDWRYILKVCFIISQSLPTHCHYHTTQLGNNIRTCVRINLQKEMKAFFFNQGSLL